MAVHGDGSPSQSRGSEAARQRGSMLIGTQVPLLDYQLPELFALTMGLKRLLCYHYPSH